MPGWGHTQKEIISLIDDIDAGRCGDHFRTIEYLSSLLFLPDGIYDLRAIKQEVTVRVGQSIDISYTVRALIRRGILATLKEIPLRSYSRYTEHNPGEFNKRVITVRTHTRAHRYKVTLLYPSQHVIRFVQKGVKFPTEGRSADARPV
jgi:hypothetical protein